MDAAIWLLDWIGAAGVRPKTRGPGLLRSRPLVRIQVGALRSGCGGSAHHARSWPRQPRPGGELAAEGVALVARRGARAAVAGGAQGGEVGVASRARRRAGPRARSASCRAGSGGPLGAGPSRGRRPRRCGRRQRRVRAAAADPRSTASAISASRTTAPATYSHALGPRSAFGQDDLIRTVSTAYANGWRQVKLYFMCGLPTETDDDVLAIAELARRVIHASREATGRKDIRCTVSIGGFVPKPHTPFQWAAQCDAGTVHDRLRQLGAALKSDRTYGRSVGYRYHDGEPSIIEGLLSRGDRRVAKVIRAAWQEGARFDGWSEFFSFERWMRSAEQALADESVDVGWYTTREREYSEVLPWDHLNAGLDRDWLWQDWQDAVNPAGAAEVEDCRWTPCYDCGVCPTMGTEIPGRPHRADPAAAVGGGQPGRWPRRCGRRRLDARPRFPVAAARGRRSRRPVKKQAATRRAAPQAIRRPDTRR